MNLGKNLLGLASAPMRVALAVTETGLDVANGALDMVQRTLSNAVGEANAQARAGSGAVAHVLGIDDAIDRVNRLVRLIDDDAPLGRALAPGGVIDRLTAPGGVLDRLTDENGGLARALAPGGIVDQLLDEDGLVERVLAEDGLAARLLAEGGLIDKLTVRNGPLEQLADVADTLNRLTPGLEVLAPTIDALQDAVVTLSQVVNPLSTIADRIPLPRRMTRRPSFPPTVRSQRIIEHDHLGGDDG